MIGSGKAQALEPAQQHEAVALVGEVDIGDHEIGTAALEDGEERLEVEREGGAQALEPQQQPERLAGLQIRLDDVDKPAFEHEIRIINVLGHSRLRYRSQSRVRQRRKVCSGDWGRPFRRNCGTLFANPGPLASTIHTRTLR